MGFEALEKLEEKNRLFETYGFCLSELQQNLLQSFLVEGLEVSEIAQNLGSSRQAVSKNVISALKKLAKMENSLRFCQFQDKIRQEVDVLTVLCQNRDFDALRKALDNLKKEI